MLKLKRTFKVRVVLPNEEGEFFCVFKRRKQTEVLDMVRESRRLDALKESEDPAVAVKALEEMLKLLGSHLESIEGLADEEGNPITVEQFMINDIYEEVITAILRAYTESISGGSEAKK
jgi:hypothetical protein